MSLRFMAKRGRERGGSLRNLGSEGRRGHTGRQLRMATLAPHRHLDQAPRLAVGKKGLDGEEIQAVAAAIGAVAAKDRRTGESEELAPDLYAQAITTAQSTQIPADRLWIHYGLT